jgi:hypothetical protein
MERVFRRVPEGRQRGVRVAQPWQVPCFEVKFACTPHKIWAGEQRQAIKRILRAENVLGAEEEIAIEMEAPGLKEFLGTKISIVKGLCDYCDERYEQWGEDLKVRFQLYAAETAAECARQIVLECSREKVCGLAT